MTLTVSVNVGAAFSTNVAVTFSSPFMDSEHVDLARFHAHERAVAPVLRQPERPPHRRRSVLAFRPEVALPLAPERANRRIGDHPDRLGLPADGGVPAGEPQLDDRLSRAEGR